jgi:hypothetical protein
MTTSNRQAGENERTYRKPSVLDRGIVEQVTKDAVGRAYPEPYGETFTWGYPVPEFEEQQTDAQSAQ